MKKLLLLSTIVFLLAGCQKEKEVTPDPLPTVSFNANPTGYGVYEFTVSATNTISYLWDFGDGSTSTQISPTHPFALNRSYSVTLTATGKGGKTTATRTIPVSDVRGTATFWMSSGNYNVDVTVDGAYLATITKNNPGTPGCNTDGTASFIFLTEGSHTFTAKEKGPLLPNKWSGSINVNGGGCSTLQLKY